MGLPKQKYFQIRIRPRGACPVCGLKFQDVSLHGEQEWRRGKPVRHGDCPGGPPGWFLDFFYQGERVRVYSDSTGQVLDTYSRARNLALTIYAEIERGVFDPSQYLKAKLNEYWVETLMERFLRAKSKEIAPSYKAHYRRMADEAAKFFNVKDAREIRRMDLVKYREHLEERKIGSKSLKNYLDHFRVFLNWLKRELQIIQIVPDFPKIDVSEPSIKWLSSDDQKEVFSHVLEEDRPIMAFLMLQGCRPGEARALKCKDVDLRTQTILIHATWSGRVYREKRKGRGAKVVVIPIHPEMREYIENRVKNNLPGAWLFVNQKNGNFYTENKLRRVWKDIQARAGIHGLRLYDCTRHSFASQLVNAGVSLFEVSKMLGHSEIRTTERYSHADLEKMRTNLQKLSLNKIVTVHDVAIEKKAVKNGL